MIHFNFGLWDWYGWRQEIKATPESYAKSLESIVRKIRMTSDARLIFAITTPPCITAEGISQGSDQQQNLPIVHRPPGYAIS